MADWFNNGLASTAPQVGLWDTNGTLLAAVTVPLGTAASLIETQANPTVTYYAVALAPGWYDIEVRAIQGGQIVSMGRVERVGVGDNFVAAGQSNAANNGAPA